MTRKSIKSDQARTDQTAAFKVADKPISGKLGIIAKAISTPKGATLKELEKKTSWQPHTIRAALSRLRKKNIAIILSEVDGRRAYRAKAGA